MARTNGKSEVDPQELDAEHELPAGEGEGVTIDSQTGRASTESSELQKLRVERDTLIDRLARLQAEFENARKLVPGPLTWKDGSSKIGILAYGSSDFAIREGLDLIKKQYGHDVDYMRIRAYPLV